MSKIISNAKKQVAERHGFESGVLGSSWRFAMEITHRKKQQIVMYEEVIELMAGAITQLTKDR